VGPGGRAQDRQRRQAGRGHQVELIVQQARVGAVLGLVGELLGVQADQRGAVPGLVLGEQRGELTRRMNSPAGSGAPT